MTNEEVLVDLARNLPRIDIDLSKTEMKYLDDRFEYYIDGRLAMKSYDGINLEFEDWCAPFVKFSYACIMSAQLENETRWAQNAAKRAGGAINAEPNL